MRCFFDVRPSASRDRETWGASMVLERVQVAGLLGLSLAAAAGLAVSPAWAGCNSGPSGTPLDSAACQANNAVGVNGLAVGYGSQAAGDDSVAIGSFAANLNDSAGITNVGAYAGKNYGGKYSTAIGRSSQAAGDFSVAVGGGTFTDGAGLPGAYADGAKSVAIGLSAASVGLNS